MATWTDRSTELTSGTTAWREAGSGDALLFLHGLGGTRGSWNPQIESFAATRRCIAWDMPGYGESTAEDPLTFERIASRLVELLDYLELGAVDMVGLSFGGMHCLHIAINHPERVGRLILADTSPAFGLDGTTAQSWKAARISALDAGETPTTMAAPVLDSIVAHPLEPSIRTELIDAFARIPSAGLRSAVECLPDHDVRESLGEISSDTLVLVGELDTETPLEYSQLLHDGIPNSALVVLAGVGHLTPSEAPREFNDHVSRFLTGQR